MLTTSRITALVVVPALVAGFPVPAPSAEAASYRSCKRISNPYAGITPPPSGIRSFTWRRWSVTGNLRGNTDRYVARSGGRRVRWVF